MAAPAEPPACCVSYGGFYVKSSSNFMLPNCKMEASLSPSSSSLSLHDPHALLPSPSPTSSPCLPHSPSHPLLSSSYTHIPSLLDSPSPLSFHLSSFKKRPASFLSALDESPPFDTAPKRICQSPASDACCAYRSREINSAFLDDALPRHSHSDEILDATIWRTGCVENVASGDLDDVLDLLLQEAEVAPTLSVQSPGSPLLAYKLDRCKEEAEEVFSCKLDYCKEESKELYTQPSTTNENNHLASSARSTRTWSDTLQDLRRGREATASEGAAMQELQTEVKLSFCEELMKQIAPTSLTAKQEQMDRNEEEEEEEEEERLQQKQCRNTQEQAIRPLGASSGRWAGPTLLDIESALAMTSPPSTTTFPFGKPPATSSSFLCSIRDILKQDPPSSTRVLSAFACKEELNLEQEDDKLSTWRRLQRRNHMEPRYTVKIRCEEDAVNDGYRWRKYGQKSIKNSPYPRSYYRCSSGKCNVKKQVERSGEDAGLLLVSYEGIHLHHRPSSLLSPTPSHTCVPPPPTCEPTYTLTHNNIAKS